MCGCWGEGVKAVVQEVLLFGSETWVLTPHMGQIIGWFQHRVALWLTGENCGNYLTTDVSALP